MFIDIDWSSILPVAAAWIVAGGFGTWLFLTGVSKLGRYLAECRETQSTALIPESLDEVIEFSGRPNYAGIRRSILRADEGACDDRLAENRQRSDW